MGDVTSVQKDSNLSLDTKHSRGRDESRSKSRLVQDSSQLDGLRYGDGVLTDPSWEKDCDRIVGVCHAHGERWIDEDASLQPERADSSSDLFDVTEAGAANERSYSASIYDKKSAGERHSGLRPGRDEELNETRETICLREVESTGSRLRGKVNAGESLPESERTPLSPTSGLRIGARTSRDKNVVKIEDPKKAIDVNSPGPEPFSAISKEEYEDRFRDCIIGLKDISDIVLKAVRAAEAEARSANAPDEAVKAAGWKSGNNGDEVLLAAEKAAATVMEAAMSISVSREEHVVEELVQVSEDRELEILLSLTMGSFYNLEKNIAFSAYRFWERSSNANQGNDQWPVEALTASEKQAPPTDRYLHDLTQYAFGVLHITTLVPYCRKLIVHATLSNNRVGMMVLLDAANSFGYVDPEVICPALNVLVNLVCPPLLSVTSHPQLVISNLELPRHLVGLFQKTETGMLTNISTPVVPSGVVGDRRISLGVGAGGPGLAAQLEQGTSLSCPLGLARDDVIAHILTKLQVGKKLSELIRDTSGQSTGDDNGRWQNELTQVAIELIAVLTNSGKETTLAATDAAAPALRRIERAGIASATPISYHSRELMQLIHEHLIRSGLTATAAMLQKETDLSPLPSTAAVLRVHQVAALGTSSSQQQWPSGRVQGFVPDATKMPIDQGGQRPDSLLPSSKKKSLAFSSSFSKRTQPSNLNSGNKANNGLKSPAPIGNVENMTTVNTGDAETSRKTPLSLPQKRKLVDNLSSTSAAKRPAIVDQACQSPSFQTPAPTRKGLSVVVDSPTATFHSGRSNFNIYMENLDDAQGTPGAIMTTPHLGANDQQSLNLERPTLDSLVVQYLKHQHCQCPAPITTLPSLSLLHPHVCPEPSRSLSAPANIAPRMGSREIRRQFSGIQIPPGNHTGEIRIFDCNTANILETQTCHQQLVTLVESASSGGNELILSSSLNEVKIWDAFSVSGGYLHTFEGCKAARFSHSGTSFAALSTDTTRRQVLLYDVQTYNLDLQLPDNSSYSGGRGYVQPIIHFNPLDTMLLWNGVLWDRRSPNTVHQFDQFTDYGGGGFHPAGNEVILNSEVWDLRKFKLLRSVPSLDQTKPAKSTRKAKSWHLRSCCMMPSPPPGPSSSSPPPGRRVPAYDGAEGPSHSASPVACLDFDSMLLLCARDLWARGVGWMEGRQGAAAVSELKLVE
ncbi:hypothetical protein GUJ93_ZPchr0458g22401 [Zizania palustris]|uniref:LisH domain-containing protein n=1 Tax=Zizania palustris TaxID=103762 RepID=A0A8J5RCM0_ZIZPA|nr:hypothetical protein GUJ93_ZPchr0458g22401 [Zizania palustris]